MQDKTSNYGRFSPSCSLTLVFVVVVVVTSTENPRNYRPLYNGFWLWRTKVSICGGVWSGAQRSAAERQ